MNLLLFKNISGFFCAIRRSGTRNIGVGTPLKKSSPNTRTIVNGISLEIEDDPSGFLDLVHF